jgi:glycosyltransferase involved in cell wall biosynthesis
VDRFLPPLDIVHVAGLSTPPTHSARLVVSVDDLRPLREAERDRQRVIQLVRAAEHGAQLVASSRAASLEVQAALGLRRGQVVIVPPAVPWPSSMVEGDALVVNLTGRATEFVQWGRQLVERSTSLGHRVIVLASRAAAIRIRQAGLNVDLRDRREAPAVLGEARAVVHLSDGARFPTFTVAAAAAGIPTAASATAVNRELLEGASLLVDDTEPEALLETIGTILADEARRAVLVAAGRARARDFSADVAARRFLALYESLVRVGVSS